MRWLGDFDIMGHFDYVARYAPYPKESVLYRDFPGLFDEIFKYLIENGKGLENQHQDLQGLRTEDFAAGQDSADQVHGAWRRDHEPRIDSHAPEQVGHKFDYFAQYVKMFGFRRLAHFEGRRLKMVTI